MKKIIYFFTLAVLLLNTACNKIEGPGGTAAIRGNVTGHQVKNGDVEIT